MVRRVDGGKRFCLLGAAPVTLGVEKEIIESVSLPLNIQDNQHHPFSGTLSDMRKEAKRMARETPIAREDNQQRRM